MYVIRGILFVFVFRALDQKNLSVCIIWVLYFSEMFKLVFWPNIDLDSYI